MCKYAKHVNNDPNEGLENDSYSFGPLDVAKQPLDSDCSHKIDSSSDLAPACLRYNFRNNRNYYNNKIELVPLVIKVRPDSKAHKLQYHLKYEEA